MNVFYVTDILFTVSSWSLVIAASLGIWLLPIPIWLSRSIVVLSFVLLAASTIIIYAYAMEMFIAYYSANLYERDAFQFRVTGNNAAAYWLPFASTCVPQFFWFRRIHNHPLPTLIIALTAATGPIVRTIVSQFL